MASQIKLVVLYYCNRIYNMSELSVDKLNQYKKTRLLTNKKISELTGISLVTVIADRLQK